MSRTWKSNPLGESVEAAENALKQTDGYRRVKAAWDEKREEYREGYAAARRAIGIENEDDVTDIVRRLWSGIGEPAV